MKQSGLILASLVLSMVAGTTVADNHEGMEATFRQLVEEKLAAFNREDASGTMRHIHTKSPEYASTQNALPSQFDALDARTKLVDLRYMGHDDEFAVAPDLPILARNFCKDQHNCRWTRKYIKEMFPNGAKTACRYAGLPRPVGGSCV